MSREVQVESDPIAGSTRYERRRRWVRTLSLVLWIAVIAFEVITTVLEPSTKNLFTTTAFVLLFLSVNAQLLMVKWSGHRSWNRVLSKMDRSSYLSELHNLPNRNYLLAELRREMPRGRATRVPFTLVLISLDSLDEIRERRGDAFVDRASLALAETLRRVTRGADFIAHLQGAHFCIMLNETTAEQAWLFLRTLPGTIAVSDGHNMFDIQVSARMHQYDMEALYATDVLRDLEEATPLRRREEMRFGSTAA